MPGLNVLSLFDGISCCRLALERAGIEVNTYYTSEIEPNAIKVSNEHYPDAVRLGDVNNWREWDIDWKNIDLVTFGSPCFTGDTLVLTDKGYIPIIEVKQGDKVLSHDNQYHEVEAFLNQGEKEIFEIKALGTYGIKTTGNHKFYVKKKKREWDNSIRRYRTVKDIEPEWVECKDLNKDYYLGYAINQESKLPLWNGVEVYTSGRVKTLKKNLNLEDENLWYLIGRYLGDGWVKARGRYNPNSNRIKYSSVIICCGKHETEEFEEKLKKVNLHYSKIEQRTVFRYQFSNVELAQFLLQFGRGAKNKFIPGFVFDLPVNLLKKMIEGYLDADGSIQDKKALCTFSTISNKLAYGIIQCIAKVEHKGCNVHKSKKKSSHIIEGRKVNQNDAYEASFKTFLKGNQPTQWFYEDGYIWLPIREVKNTHDFENVYDITVKDSHSFTANGVIAHNCTGFSYAGKGLNFEDPQSKLFFVAVDILNYIKQINPDIKFLMENVIMRQEWADTITNYLNVQPVLINSRLLSAQDRKRLYWCNWDITQPMDANISFSDIVEDGWFCASMRGRRIKNGKRCDYDKTIPIVQQIECRMDNKANCCTTVSKDNVAVPIKKERQPATETEWRYLFPIEYERLQTLPDNYTACIKSPHKRRALCGLGWTVDVIAHIFKEGDFNNEY